MRAFVVFLCTFCVASALSKSRVIGGQEAEPHSIPYQAFLKVYSDTRYWYCGGSLISQNYILTAAHCGVNATEFHITLGAHKPLETEDTQVNIVSKEIKLHEDYDAEHLFNDIALIRLPSPVNYTLAIQPVVLPAFIGSNVTYEGVTARVSGWGLTDMYETKPSEVLNYLDMKIISNENCQKNFPAATIINSIVCTSGENNTEICSGDSGGPLTINDHVQIGIVSFGVIFCMSGYPSGFTRVTNFLSWVAANSDV